MRLDAGFFGPGVGCETDISMRVLVVEDDPEIAGYIDHGLTQFGHEASIALTGNSGLEFCANGSFDAIVLDRMLPDTDGITVLQTLRQSSLQRSPVLLLSALSSVEDRIEGLTAGADDYLTKPFDLAELNARLAAIARRAVQPPVLDSSIHVLAVGRLSLDPAGHRACLDTKEISLNRKEYSLLAFLMQHVDRVVTRAMLLEGVWHLTFEPTTNIVESNLSRLRARLQALGIDPIETRRGAGYILRTERCA